MKIVYATDQYWPCVSGVSVSIDSFREELESMGHEVHVLAPSYRDDRSDIAPDPSDHVHRFRSKKVFFNDENRLVRRSERRAIRDLLDRLAPDILHVQTEFSMAALTQAWAKKRNVPIVMSAHTNWSDLIHIYMPWLPHGIAQIACHWQMFTAFRRVDAIAVPTSLMDALISSYWIRKPMRVIPTGIHAGNFAWSPGETTRLRKDLLELNKDLRKARIMLFVGRLGTEKDIPFLVETLERLLPTHPDLKLVVVGEGPARKDLEDLVHQRGLENHVVMVGFVPHRELRTYYSLADVFVFASKVESQGLVVLEAMQCGLPVVAIGKMGTREVMGGDNGGFMVDDDQDEFVEAVQRLLDDPELRARKSQEARSHAIGWTMGVQARKMEQFYKAVLRRKSIRG